MNSVPEVLEYGRSTRVEGAVLREITCTASAQVCVLNDGAISLCVERAGESACIRLTRADARHLAMEILKLAGSEL